MREVLHHFGLIDNRVRVGIGLSDQVNNELINGVVVGLAHRNGARCKAAIMVDRADKLNHLNKPMVLDMVEQVDKLGLQVELISVYSSKYVHTYRPVADGEVQLVSRTPLHKNPGEAA
jgi:hypothetical protein